MSKKIFLRAMPEELSTWYFSNETLPKHYSKVIIRIYDQEHNATYEAENKMFLLSKSPYTTYSTKTRNIEWKYE